MVKFIYMKRYGDEIMSKTVLITGGAKGIGRSIAENFARKGYKVIFNYYSSAKEAEILEQKLQMLGAEAFGIQGDITNNSDIKKIFGFAKEKFGEIDILINNAGISQFKLFSDITEDDWDQMLNVHLKGMFNCCKEVVPDMISRKQGKIINISSIWGMVGASCEVHYSTAKAGIIGFTKALAKELGPSNIQVNCISPGVIETDMLSSLSEEEKCSLKSDTPLMRLGKPEDIASLALYLSSEEADFITGQVISPNGGFVV